MHTLMHKRKLPVTSFWTVMPNHIIPTILKVYKLKFDLQQGSLTVQVAGEHQPYRKHFYNSELSKNTMPNHRHEGFNVSDVCAQNVD